jgi:hypothetical protein
MDWRKSVDDGVAIRREKRRWMYQTKGIDVPVNASAARKKNNQRGPTVGSVVKSTKIKPTHPMRAMIPAEIKRLW